jgi:heme iron utilization protein
MLATVSADPRRKISENPGVVFEDAAREHGVSPRAIDVTVIVHTENGIMEFGGPVPKGQVARGYFNLMGRTGFHGHLRHDRCGGIAFIERPFMSRTSCLLALLNKDGGVMFKIFVGRDDRSELKADQLERFRALRERLCAPA